MNRFKKNFVTCARILSNGLWWRTGSKKWPRPIFTKTKNKIPMTVATPAVLAFYADSKYIKFFPFIITHPKPKTEKIAWYLKKRGNTPKKQAILLKILLLDTSYNPTVEISSSNLRNMEFHIFFSKETSSLHVYVFFSRGWLYQTEGQRKLRGS